MVRIVSSHRSIAVLGRVEMKRNGKYVLLLVSFLFFLIPFFWFRPGEMDIGGDSSRLYYYDPVSYLYNHSLFGISPSGLGGENIGFYNLPYVSLMDVLRQILSPTLLISFIHGMSLSFSFLFFAFVVQEIIRALSDKDSPFASWVSMVAGIYYVLFPATLDSWDKVLLTHDRIFVYPLMMYLLLRYIRLGTMVHIIIGLLLSFIFSANFSFAAAPSFFAFYPISFILLLGIAREKKVLIPRLKGLGIGLLLFILLQGFHIVPQVVSMLSPGSVLNTYVFTSTGKIDRGLGYFTGISDSIKLTYNLFGLPQIDQVNYIVFIALFVPFVVLLALYYVSRGKIVIKNPRVYVLIVISFLIVLYFSTANITGIGFNVYKSFFNLPGFSMFRNYYGQWQQTHVFYFVLLFSTSLFIIFSRFKRVFGILFLTIFTLAIVANSYPLLSGKSVKKELWETKNKKAVTSIDPDFSSAINFIRSLPRDSRFLTFPFSDPGYQIVTSPYGAYQGPSLTAYLGAHQDFASAVEFGKLDEFVRNAVLRNDVKRFIALMGRLNVRYIFWNSDTDVYDEFKGFPYRESRKYMPATQEGYRKLLSQIPAVKIFTSGDKYHVFEIKDQNVSPRAWISSTLIQAEAFEDNIESILDFEEFTNQNNAAVAHPIFSFNDIGQIFLAKKDNLYAKAIKNPGSPRVLHHAFATIPPWSPLYKFIRMREEYSIRRNIPILFDRLMFTSAKRIFEIEKWGDELGIDRDISQIENALSLKTAYLPLPLKNIITKDLGLKRESWEELLRDYAEVIRISENYIKTTEDLNNRFEPGFLLTEYLRLHWERLTYKIGLLKNKSSEEKIYLTSLIDRMFETLLRDNVLQDISGLDIRYTILVSKKGDSYKIFGKSKSSAGDENLVLSSTSLEKKENIVSVGSNWTRMGSLNSSIDENISIDSRQVSFQDNLEKPILSPFENLNFNGDFYSYVADKNRLADESGDVSGLWWSTKKLSKDELYVLSFEYKTGDVPARIKVFEKEFIQDMPARRTVNDWIKAGDWMSYNAVIRSETGGESFIQITGGEPRKKSSLSIRSMSLRHVLAPDLYAIPNGSIRKEPTMLSGFWISPVTYIYEAQSSASSFVFAFNHEYSSHWKLSLVDVNDRYLSWIRKISVPENIKQFLYTFVGLFQSGSTISDHFPINGNMNGWYVNQRVIPQSGYVFVLQYDTERYFLISLAISVLTFLWLLLYISFVYFKKLIFHA